MIDLSNSKNFAPFDGDGRRRMSATTKTHELWPTCKFESVSNAMARRLIEKFVEEKRFRFNYQAPLLWVLMVWCNTMALQYRVIRHPIGGWYVLLDDAQADDDLSAEPEFEDDNWPLPTSSAHQSLEPSDESTYPFDDDETAASSALIAYYRSLYGSGLDEEDISALSRRLRC